MDYSKAIRLARARRGQQQRDLAKAAGLDPSYVSLLESGRRTPSPEVIEKLAVALAIPLPLFELLAAEQQDLLMWEEDEVGELAKGLLDLVTGAINEGGA